MGREVRVDRNNGTRWSATHIDTALVPCPGEHAIMKVLVLHCTRPHMYIYTLSGLKSRAV